MLVHLGFVLKEKSLVFYCPAPNIIKSPHNEQGNKKRHVLLKGPLKIRSNGPVNSVIYLAIFVLREQNCESQQKRDLWNQHGVSDVPQP